MKPAIARQSEREGSGLFDAFIEAVQLNGRVGEHAGLLSIQNVGTLKVGAQTVPWFRTAAPPETSLGDYLRSEDAPPMAWRQALGLGRDLAKTLAFLHERGVLHLNVQPDCVYFSQQGALLGGLQFARRHGGQAAFEGSPSYTAPEQWGERSLDGRTDIYALGVVLYYALTCVICFHGEMIREKHLYYDPDPPSVYAEGIPEQVSKIVLRCLAKKRQARYQSAAELVGDLEAALL